MSKILLVEDEVAVANFVQKGLTEEGYSVSVAFNGKNGIKMAAESDFDLIILDIMLPDKNGIEVCKELRDQVIKTPILFLTALGTPENIAVGLDTGGDDYLVKPFKFIELNARVKALLRRSDNKANVSKKSIYTFSDLTVDDEAKTVERNGTLISLTATEYRLLLTLIKNKGKVLSRADLLEKRMGYQFQYGYKCCGCIHKLLTKKIDADKENKLIHTIIGMGYVLKET